MKEGPAADQPSRLRTPPGVGPRCGRLVQAASRRGGDGRLRRFIKATRLGEKSEVLAWAQRNAPPWRTAAFQQYSYLITLPQNSREDRRRKV